MTADTAPIHHGYISDKKDYLDRLKRIGRPGRGISRMIDDEKYCIDISPRSPLSRRPWRPSPLGSSTTTSATASPTPPVPGAPRPTPE